MKAELVFGRLKKLLAGLVLFFAGFCIQAQNLAGFEFVNREIDEILYSVSLYTGTAIVCDDTVSGKATFRFAGNDFDSTFESFLKSQRLFVEKKDGCWTVSRVCFRELENCIELEALDVKPQRLVERIAGFFGTEITYDVLDETPVSIHTTGTCAADFTATLVRQLGKGYELVSYGDALNISRIAQSAVTRIESANAKLSVDFDSLHGVYSVDAADVSFGNLLERFFSAEKKQFILCADASSHLRRMKFSGKNFYETLNILCSNCGYSWKENDGIFYIYSSGKSMLELLSDESKIWKSYIMEYIPVEEGIVLMENLLGKTNWMKTSDNGFSVFETEENHGALKVLFDEKDVRPDYFVITLKYITSDELMSFLPPGIDSSKLKKTTQDNTLFFTGSRGEYEFLQQSLVEIDVPARRLSYDLLVIQYQCSGEENWEGSIAAKPMEVNDVSSGNVVLGSVLGLNLDVVSAFGYRFAFALQNAMDESKAHVFADTKLHGVSGRKISFRNTNTFRYRDSNVNPETGIPVFTGITREIISGLSIDVTGWVSGDGMITSSITASISRQGIDTSAKTGNPPPTTEKVITTEVRGRSGEVIVLSGLLQDDESFSNHGANGLAKLPLVGKLFSSGNRSTQKTEMIIYLVPHWLQDEEALPSGSGIVSEEEFCSAVVKDFLESENKSVMNEAEEVCFE